MKIAIDISQSVYGTGVSRYTTELVRSLLKIDSKNQYVLFGASLRAYLKLLKIKRQLSNYANVSFKLIPIPLFIFEILWNKLHLVPIETFVGSVDLVHTSDWLEPPVKVTTKKVTTVHDMVVYLFASFAHPKVVANQKAKLNYVKKETDLIIADSQTTKEDLTKFLQIPSEKIKVVYLSASGEFKPQDQDKIDKVLAKYRIKKPYVLSVATHEPRKNLQKLIDACETISKKREDASLVLVGKYGWGPTPQDQDNSKLIYTGFVSQNDLIELYSGCRVFVYPSLYEGFGLPILEAMACGAPVITSNNSSMAEIAKDAAILIDPRSENQISRAIEIVLDLALEDYQKMVNASLNRARKYSWVKTARQTLEIYKKVVGKVNSAESESHNKKPVGEKPKLRQLSP